MLLALPPAQAVTSGDVVPRSYIAEFTNTETVSGFYLQINGLYMSNSPDWLT